MQREVRLTCGSQTVDNVEDGRGEGVVSQEDEGTAPPDPGGLHSCPDARHPPCLLSVIVQLVQSDSQMHVVSSFEYMLQTSIFKCSSMRFVLCIKKSTSWEDYAAASESWDIQKVLNSIQDDNTRTTEHKASDITLTPLRQYTQK